MPHLNFQGQAILFLFSTLTKDVLLTYIHIKFIYVSHLIPSRHKKETFSLSLQILNDTSQKKSTEHTYYKLFLKIKRQLVMVALTNR